MANSSESLRRIYATVSRIPKGQGGDLRSGGGGCGAAATRAAGRPRAARARRGQRRPLASGGQRQGDDQPARRSARPRGVAGRAAPARGRRLRRARDSAAALRLAAAAVRGAGRGARRRSDRAVRRRIAVKRVYDPPSRSDGTRVLVDRLWPRGIAKAKARVDAWLKEVGPSTALRTWFGHDPARWTEFQRRYHRELANSGAAQAGRRPRAARARSRCSSPRRTRSTTTPSRSGTT